METERAASVAVLGCSRPTFTVAGHPSGVLVPVVGLEPGGRQPYVVHLDGRSV